MINFVIVCVSFIFFSCHCWTQRFGVFSDFTRIHYISSGSNHLREMRKEEEEATDPHPCAGSRGFINNNQPTGGPFFCRSETALPRELGQRWTFCYVQEGLVLLNSMNCGL